MNIERGKRGRTATQSGQIGTPGGWKTIHLVDTVIPQHQRLHDGHHTSKLMQSLLINDIAAPNH